MEEPSRKTFNVSFGPPYTHMYTCIHVPMQVCPHRCKHTQAHTDRHTLMDTNVGHIHTHGKKQRALFPSQAHLWSSTGKSAPGAEDCSCPYCLGQASLNRAHGIFQYRCLVTSHVSCRPWLPRTTHYLLPQHMLFCGLGSSRLSLQVASQAMKR